MDLGGAGAVFSLWLCLLAAVPEGAVKCVLPVVLLNDVSAKGVISVGRESPKRCLPPKTVGAGEMSNRMKFGPDKVAVIEGDALRRQHLASILADAGFQVFAEPAATTKNIVESMPDVIVMTGNPLQFDCCDLLADVKGSEQTRNIRVIMMSAGASAERVRGLELGADDVLSLPIDDRELLARVRSQMREKRPEDELRETVRGDRQSRHQGRRVLDALSQG